MRPCSRKPRNVVIQLMVRRTGFWGGGDSGAGRQVGPAVGLGADEVVESAALPHGGLYVYGAAGGLLRGGRGPCRRWQSHGSNGRLDRQGLGGFAIPDPTRHVTCFCCDTYFSGQNRVTMECFTNCQCI